jgi:ubiquinone biosynthesis protein
MMLGIINRDPGRITMAILNMTGKKGHINFESLEMRIFELLDQYIDLPLEDMDLRQVFTELIQIIFSYHISIPANLALMIKAIIAIEGIGKDLDPDFHLISVLEKFTTNMFFYTFNLPKILNKLYLTALDYEELLHDLPIELREIMKLLKTGQLKIEFEHRGLENLINKLEKIGYRLTVGVVLAAILISSALIIFADIPPHWQGMPLLGISGFLLSGIIGFVLLIFVFFRLGK